MILLELNGFCLTANCGHQCDYLGNVLSYRPLMTLKVKKSFYIGLTKNGSMSGQIPYMEPSKSLMRVHIFHSTFLRVQVKVWDAFSWKGQLEKTRNWKVSS